MKSPACPRCGLHIQHATPEDCLAHLAPRYKLAAASLKSMHDRYRALEDRMERMRIQNRVIAKDAREQRTVAGRLSVIEQRILALEARER